MSKSKTHISKNNISLIRIKKNYDYVQILYEILLKRRKNISHISMPNYEQHINFVLNHPYRIWFIVKYNEKIIGTAYLLKNNSIGINVLENQKIVIPLIITQILKKYKPLKAIPSIRTESFDFNLSPSNKDFISILENLGAELSQVTYTI
ncbi:hypothetical protein [Polynucleobacter rarus]|uniref:hypothetical protein n=1 Tax=Polynucleobacter rarus TaxID=556055 RepID=UPI000D3EC40A|nr:hypothetical protein [Polynucleobacter rarus]